MKNLKLNDSIGLDFGGQKIIGQIVYLRNGEVKIGSHDKRLYGSKTIEAMNAGYDYCWHTELASIGKFGNKLGSITVINTADEYNMFNIRHLSHKANITTREVDMPF